MYQHSNSRVGGIQKCKSLNLPATHIIMSHKRILGGLQSVVQVRVVIVIKPKGSTMASLPECCNTNVQVEDAINTLMLYIKGLRDHSSAVQVPEGHCDMFNW